MSDTRIPLALCCPLHGSRLIEASAGTGKTFTISALYLRLVLGHGGEAGFGRELLPPEILVVTFTDAATQELRDRIRARLVQAAQAFRGELEEPDPILRRLLADIDPAEHAGSARKLDIAAQWMDQAAVSTIHSWCQRMLREHAFDSGSLFEQSLETDHSDLLAEVVRDYWRQHCYPLQGPALGWVNRHWQYPDQLGTQVRRWLDVHAGEEEGSLQLLLEQQLQQAAEMLEGLRRPWLQWLDELQLFLERCCEAGSFNGNKLKPSIYQPRLDQLRAWCADSGELTFKNDYFKRFTHEGLQDACKKGVELELPAGVCAALDDMATLEQRLAALPDPTQPALLHAAGWISRRFEAEKLRRAQMGFDDMLTRLDAALQGSNGQRLAEVIRRQFPVALIDEFQDTDPLQYRIFDSIYRVQQNDPDTALLLIGDPKQAIYAFRGADIHTYLGARTATAGRHENLDTNFRSSQAMVAAVNRVFSQAEQQWPAGAFLFRHGEDNPLPFLPVKARGRDEVWTLDGQPGPALTAWHLGGEQPLSGESYRSQMAERCASAMVELLRAGQRGATGFADPQKGLQPVRPADMAVLVRTGREAQAIRQALAARGVRSVYLSDKDSVLATLEAADMLRWLRACADPGNDRLLRAALASPTLALSWAELELLNQDERLWERWVDQFRDYRQRWLRQGVLPMLHRLLHDFRLPARLVEQGDGERRLTNLLHLAELLQQAARELDGEQALIRHLAELIRRAQDGSGGEEQILRLESDADLVKVVTIHKSKGLEYPLVFLPFIAHSRAVKAGEPVRLHDGGRARWILEPTEEQLQQADRERLGEDLRLLYVALTRARHACWLGLADLKSGQGRRSVLHHSAIAWLLAGGEPLPEPASLPGWLQQWQPHGADGVVAVVPAPEAGEQPYQPVADDSGELHERNPHHPPFESWWIGSYSALAVGGEAPDSPLSGQLNDDERNHRFLPLKPGEVPSIHRFPRGPQPGTFLHGLLELAGREGFAQLTDSAVCRERLYPRCQRRGWGEWSDCLGQWLSGLLQRPGLVPGSELSLADLSERQYQVEMEFLFSAARVDVQRIDQLVCAHTLDAKARAPLLRDRLNGLFKGFIDLVFEHQGRYYVVDYKSNWLGVDADAYTAEAMGAAVLEHRYDLQYVFYLLALHRQLRARLVDYDYDRHVGGALYWFIRGGEASGAGIWHDRPPRELIESLDRLFAGQAQEESVP
ncbi:exodeoxyribonuclease V subunit beta [Pseudomonas sp. MYb185]|uniref:exodeoxyribonuclease V subunit beta n=1 Tax=Pseudomonas sp. MYb185 TaxID=1848729 RepID=UPI000CFC6DD9|nr:exodeoxyribonuclease V subunit beta [Pseudomonas sp. MYb185]PRB79913.1 exodeoxyribonuclease V subunit beta [Pseudomonas sp. MYb185]